MFIGLATGRAFRKVGWWISMRRKRNKDDTSTGNGLTTVKSEDLRDEVMRSSEFPNDADAHEHCEFPSGMAAGLASSDRPRLSPNENLACV